MLACSIDGLLCQSPLEATISVKDHGLLYGDGVFEGLRFYYGSVFKMQAHLDRLRDSAAALSLIVSLSDAELKQTIQETIDEAGIESGYIRLMITRGEGPMGLDPTSCTNGRCIVIVDQLSMVSTAAREQGATAIFASTRRLSSDQIDPRIKSLNYLNQIMAKLEAKAAGADEAIILNNAGRIAEGTADNIFLVKRGKLFTPPTTEGALEGITRNTIIELAVKLGIETKETPLAMFDLLTADECFLTGTGAELIPVTTIAGRNIGKVPEYTTYAKLSAAFFEYVEDQCR